MTYILHRYWSLIEQTAEGWADHKDAQAGAALAYYSVFSIGPLMVIAVAIAGFFFGQDTARAEVELQLRGLVGDAAASAVDAMLAGASKPHQGLVATIIGTSILLFTAVGVVVQLKSAFNTVWEVDTKKISGAWQFIRAYLVSLAAVISVGFLLLVSLLFSAALSAAGKYLGTQTPVALQITATIVSFAAITFVFAMMFKWLPDTRVDWRDVWLGAAITAALFEIGKLLIGVYIARQSLDSTYGAAAAYIVLLIWVYYSSQIVLLGAEFTHTYACWRRPLEVPPRIHADGRASSTLPAPPRAAARSGARAFYSG